MKHNQAMGRAWVQATPLAVGFNYIICGLGAALCLYGLIAGWLFGDMPLKFGLACGGLGIMFIGMIAFSRAMARLARRKAAEWRSEEAAN